LDRVTAQIPIENDSHVFDRSRYIHVKSYSTTTIYDTTSYIFTTLLSAKTFALHIAIVGGKPHLFLQILDQPFYGLLECAFLGSFYCGVGQITTSSKSMMDSVEVSAAVSRRKIGKFLIGSLGE